MKSTSSSVVTSIPMSFRHSSPLLLCERDGRPRKYAIVTPPANPTAAHVFSVIVMMHQFRLPDGTTLGAPLDASCSVKTRVNYVYKSTAPIEGTSSRGPLAPSALKPLPSLTVLPRDVAWTTTSLGQRVPYVVRIETGTINRAIYQIAILHDPTSEAEPGPLAASKGWNQRLVYTFGGGCIGGWFKQGLSIGLRGEIIDDVNMRKGYAEASSTLNVFGNNCSDVISAETMMMVKERFIEAYGKPLYTIGQGGSGGAYQQLQIVDNYPGLLDGIIPSNSFPDVLESIQAVIDLQLLNNYFVKHSDALTDKQKAAVAGVGVLQTLTEGSKQAKRINPTVFCPPGLPLPKRYNAATNPKGSRCDVFDHTINIYGRDPETGFARRPIDNTGVQYGLAALNAGAINTAQFLDLNEKIGGYDNDGNMVGTRAIADPLALRAAYQTGRSTNAGGGLAQVPIIDVRAYRDQLETGDIHLKVHSFALRERLRRANGTTANEVLLVSDQGFFKSSVAEYATTKMDEWLNNLRRDVSNEPILSKIARAKPADLVDSCSTPGGESIIETQAFGSGRCSEVFPSHPSPRMVAGGPVTNDILKCQLKPIDFRDYAVTLTEADKVRLRTIFPTGVCDFTKPGVEQQSLAGSWLSF